MARSKLDKLKNLKIENIKKLDKAKNLKKLTKFKKFTIEKIIKSKKPEIVKANFSTLIFLTSIPISIFT